MTPTLLAAGIAFGLILTIFLALIMAPQRSNDRGN